MVSGECPRPTWGTPDPPPWLARRPSLGGLAPALGEAAPAGSHTGLAHGPRSKCPLKGTVTGRVDIRPPRFTGFLRRSRCRRLPLQPVVRSGSRGCPRAGPPGRRPGEALCSRPEGMTARVSVPKRANRAASCSPEEASGAGLHRSAWPRRPPRPPGAPRLHRSPRRSRAPRIPWPHRRAGRPRTQR